STITSAPCSTRSRIAAMSRMTSVGLTCTTSRSIFPIIAVLLLLRPLLRRLKRKATRRGHPPPLPCCCCSWWLPPNHPQTLPGSRDPADRMKSSVGGGLRVGLVRIACLVRSSQRVVRLLHGYISAAERLQMLQKPPHSICDVLT